jgi:DnaK suppressor protein
MESQTTMTRKELDQFRESLESRRADILRMLTRVEKEGRSLPGDYPQDLGDRSVANLTKELLFQHGTQQRTLLRQIEVALERIREGTFGECISCGQQIAVKRLNAMPFTSYCRDCQERLERETVTDEQLPQRQRA